MFTEEVQNASELRLKCNQTRSSKIKKKTKKNYKKINSQHKYEVKETTGFSL